MYVKVRQRLVLGTAGTGTGIFQEDKVNTMAADAVSLCCQIIDSYGIDYM